MVVQTLLSIEMKTEEMILSGYNYMSWVDRRLMWNPADYDGLEEIRLRVNQVWTPGIIFHNARDGQFGQAFAVNVGVRASGDIEWLPPALYKAACSINVKLFPFDKQKCRLIFRSTDYDATVFDFRKDCILLNVYDSIAAILVDSQYNIGYIVQLIRSKTLKGLCFGRIDY